jgi:uncharacterized membrane protein YfcA
MNWTFPIRPIERRTAVWFLGLLILLGGVGLAEASLAFVKQIRPLWFGVGILLFVTALVGYSLHGARHGRIELEGESFRIRGDLYRKRVQLAEIAEARRVNLELEPGLKPKWKLCGTALPGFQSGWFTLAGGGRGYLFLTGLPDAVCITLRSGLRILLNPAEPEAFLAALRR